MATFSVEGLTSILEKLLPEPHAGLLSGLLFGTKATLSNDLYDQLVITGTIHIIALSGMNISILMELVACTLERFVGKRVAAIMTLGVIIWFVFFVGASAPIVRAAIMGSLTILALLFGRQTWALLSLCLSVGIMLLVNPSWSREISFQLSVAATLGIILFGPTIQQGNDEKNNPSTMSSLRFFVEENFRLTMAAQVFTIPLILFYFHRISLIAPAANIAIGWVIAPVTMFGWVTVVVGFVWLPLAQPTAWVCWTLLEYLVRTVQILSQIPFANFGL